MTPADLATRQLAAYNAADLDAFCACFHPEVKVYDGEELVMDGLEAFRAGYEGLFSGPPFGATVDERVEVHPHIVEREKYWRTDKETGGRSGGELLVRYSVSDDLIATVQFLRGE